MKSRPRSRPTLKSILMARNIRNFTNFICQLSLTISLRLFAESSWPHYTNYRPGHYSQGQLPYSVGAIVDSV